MRKGLDRDYDKGTYPWLYVTHIICNCEPSNKAFNLTIRILESVASLLAAPLYNGSPDKNDNLC